MFQLVFIIILVYLNRDAINFFKKTFWLYLVFLGSKKYNPNSNKLNKQDKSGKYLIF